MRSFIVLCLIAVACADKLGYNYQPVGHSNAGLSFAPGGSSGGLFGSPSNERNSYIAPSAGSDSFASPSSLSPSYAVPSGDSGSFASPSSGSPSYAAPAGVDKEFYTYTANEDDFNDPAESQRVANAHKQSLRVIFIKGPENNGLENAVLNLAKQAAEQKTAIYVLHKQPDFNDLANKFNAARNHNNNKPEVHFVKYRTPEDAHNAQRQIQSQYDNLGGPSQSHNGGIAPAINFASQSPQSYQGNQGAASTLNQNYLPASIFRRRFRL